MIAVIGLLPAVSLSLSLPHSLSLCLMINSLGFKYLLSCALLCFGRGMWPRQEGAGGWSKLLGSERLRARVCENICKTEHPPQRGEQESSVEQTALQANQIQVGRLPPA